MKESKRNLFVAYQSAINNWGHYQYLLGIAEHEKDVSFFQRQGIAAARANYDVANADLRKLIRDL